MEVLLYQIALGATSLLLVGLLIYMRIYNKRFIKERTDSKKRVLSLRNELHDTGEPVHKRRRQSAFFQRVCNIPSEAILIFPIHGDRQIGTCMYANAAACKYLEITDDEWKTLDCTQLESIPMDKEDQPDNLAQQEQIGTASPRICPLSFSQATPKRLTSKWQRRQE